jgi:hypothetical protein
MASLIYDSFADDLSRGNIDGDTDTFYGMLVTNGYTPNKATHTKRSDVTNEVVGTGYTAGGQAVAMTIAKDTVNHRETWTPANPSWPGSTITGRGMVIYKRRGGVASADELVCYIDFGADISSTGGPFAVNISTPLTIQN